MDNKNAYWETGAWIPSVLINKKPIKSENISIVEASYCKRFNVITMKLDMFIKMQNNIKKIITIKGFPFPFVLNAIINPQVLNATMEFINNVQHPYDFVVEQGKNGYLHILIRVKNDG